MSARRKCMADRGALWIFRWTATAILSVGFVGLPVAQQSSGRASSSSTEPQYQTVVNTCCPRCHNSRTKAGNLQLDPIVATKRGDDWEVWERVDGKVRGRQTAPDGARRPGGPA